MGRNLVKFKKKLMTSSLIRKYDVIIVILMLRQLRKWKVFIVLFVFGWIKLKFAVRGNFRLLISNRNSETQYQFENLIKCHFSFLRSWFFSPALPHELVIMATMNVPSSIF